MVSGLLSKKLLDAYYVVFFPGSASSSFFCLLVRLLILLRYHELNKARPIRSSRPHLTADNALEDSHDSICHHVQQHANTLSQQ